MVELHGAVRADHQRRLAEQVDGGVGILVDHRLPELLLQLDEGLGGGTGIHVGPSGAAAILLIVRSAASAAIGRPAGCRSGQSYMGTPSSRGASAAAGCAR